MGCKLISELKRLKNVPGPKILHVITTKGKGLRQAEEDQVTYHAPGKFNADTGDLIPKSKEMQPPKFQDVFGKTLVELASKNERIVAITPAMPTGSSLKYMMDTYPKRAFDVGIAEQHAVTLAAGLATQGMIVFCNIYSTFLQRAYDQLIHDVCLQKLPVIFCRSNFSPFKVPFILITLFFLSLILVCCKQEKFNIFRKNKLP